MHANISHHKYIDLRRFFNRKTPRRCRHLAVIVARDTSFWLNIKYGTYSSAWRIEKVASCKKLIKLSLAKRSDFSSSRTPPKCAPQIVYIPTYYLHIININTAALALVSLRWCLPITICAEGPRMFFVAPIIHYSGWSSFVRGYCGARALTE